MPNLQSLFSGGGGGGGTIFMVVILVAMFAMMIIPQRRREKKIKDMLGALKAGDRIKTIGGFYGTVTNINNDIFTIACGPDKVKLTIARTAIASVDTSEVENTEEPAAS